MKEIVLYEDEESKKTAKISDKIILAHFFAKVGRDLKCIDSMVFRPDEIKKIYHAIEEEG